MPKSDDRALDRGSAATAKLEERFAGWAVTAQKAKRVGYARVSVARPRADPALRHVRRSKRRQWS